jgi:predicted PurR-regulated permease PerM
VVFAVLFGTGWVLARQLDGASEDLPRFRTTFVAKVSTLRNASHGGTVEVLQQTLDSVKRDLASSTGEPRSARVIIAERAAEHAPFGMLGPVMGLAASAGLVFTLAIVMLLERRDLRDRIIELAATSPSPHGHSMKRAAAWRASCSCRRS